MDPKYLAEVWQALSVLSDAQDVLQADLADPDVAIKQIDHAKKHLIHAMEMSNEEQPLVLIKVNFLQSCTLVEGEEHKTNHAEGESSA